MNVANIGLYDAHTVNGVNVTTCTTADEMVKLGHNVYFYGFGEKNAVYKQGNVTVREFKPSFFGNGAKSFKKLLKENPDDIDVFHIRSVFRPENWFASYYLRKFEREYAISTHGGYDPQIFERSRFKKLICYNIFDKPCLQGATAALTCGGESEIRDLKRLQYTGPIFPVWDPIQPQRKIEVPNNKELLYLGRYDVQCKGLDILFKIFKEIQSIDTDVKLRLYGDAENHGDLNALKEKLGLKNVFINRPIYGDDKMEVIQNTNLYIQTSRWESFGRSIAEAMAMGIPVATNEIMNISSLVKKKNLGITLNTDYATSARKIVDFLNDTESLQKTSKRCYEIATREFSPRSVALKNIDFYTEYFDISPTKPDYERSLETSKAS